jgi:hypothetical protein
MGSYWTLATIDADGRRVFDALASRARAKGYNVPEGSGLESNRMTPDLRRAATTRGPEVVASQGVVAR